MDVRDELFPIFIKETAKILKILQHYLLDAALSGCDPEKLEAAFRAAHTLKGTALLVQVDSVHQIGRRIESLLERHLSAKTGPTVVECEAMELAVAWLQRLLVDLQEGRSGSTSLVADALTALELAARFPGKTPLVELLDSDAQQRAPQLSDPFASDPELLLDDEEILRLAKDPFADDPDFGIGSSLLPEPVELLSKPAEPDQAAVDHSPAEPEVDSSAEVSDRPLQPVTAASSRAEIPFDPFADDFSFIDVEGLSSDSLPTEVAPPEPSAEQAERVEPISAVANEAVAQLDDPFADDSGFDEIFAPEPAADAAKAEAAAKVQDESVAAAGSVEVPDADKDEQTQENVASLSLPNDAVGPQRQYVCCCFDLSGRNYYLPIEYMVEVAEIPQLFPLPLAPPLVSGLVNLCSQVMPVIDLSGLSQLQQPAAGVRRLIVVEYQREWLAFLADGSPYLSEEFIGDKIDLPTFLQRHKALVTVNVIQFSCAGQKLVIPSALVEEIVDLTSAANNTGEQSQWGSVQRIDLADLLQLSRQQSAPAHGIVSQSEGTPIMLLVDAVLGQEDTVIKSFGFFLQELPYFSGSSLAGDGTVRLVIDPARMQVF